jgi:hypothetical protein
MANINDYASGDSPLTIIGKILRTIRVWAAGGVPVSVGGGTSSTVVTLADQVVAVAGTRINFTAQAVTREVIITADLANTNQVYIGDITVAASKKGIVLSPLGVVRLAVSNTNLLYMDADTAGNRVGVVVI